MAEIAVVELPQISIEYPHPYTVVGHIIHRYKTELRPQLLLGRMPAIPLSDFEADMRRIGDTCEELGPLAYAAQRMVLRHLERAIKGTSRTKGVPRLKYTRDLAESLRSQLSTINALLEDNKFYSMVFEKNGSDAAN